MQTGMCTYFWRFKRPDLFIDVSDTKTKVKTFVEIRSLCWLGFDPGTSIKLMLGVAVFFEQLPVIFDDISFELGVLGILNLFH